MFKRQGNKSDTQGCESRNTHAQVGQAEGTYVSCHFRWIIQVAPELFSSIWPRMQSSQLLGLAPAAVSGPGVVELLYWLLLTHGSPFRPTFFPDPARRDS